MHGLAGSYGSAETMEDLAAVLTTTGPVEICIPWHATMRRPRNGLLTVDTATDHGWHFVALIGYDPALHFNPMPRKQRRRTRQRLRKHDMGEREAALRDKIRPRREPAFLIRNSWGEDWADGGDAWIRASDLETLLTRTGPMAGANSYAYDWRPQPDGSVAARLTAG